MQPEIQSRSTAGRIKQTAQTLICRTWTGVASRGIWRVREGSPQRFFLSMFVDGKALAALALLVLWAGLATTPVTTRWWGGRLRSGDEDFLLQPCSGKKYWQLDIANVCTGSQRCIAFLPGVIMTARFSGACVLQPFQPRHCTIKSKWQSHGTRGSSSAPRRTFSWDVDGAARTLSESARGGFSCLSHWWPCRAWWKRSSRARLRLFTIQR